MRKKIFIVGGGASGLAAAVSAAQMQADVTILERLSRVGKKILLTGNGRCNLGSSTHDDMRYHGTLPQAKQILQRFDTAAFFRQLGLFVRTDSEGRMYPLSNTAASVLDALRMECERLGVQTHTDTMLTDLLPQKNGTWRILTTNGDFHADAVILAVGGSACPACGTDGNLLPLLKKLGHTIIPPLPALCPIPSDAKRLKSLKGLRVRAAATALVDGKPRKTEIGEVQFTETALSGICLFNLSRLAAMYGKRMEISLDLLPDDLPQDFLSDLMKTRGNAQISDLLTGILPKRIAECCIKQAIGTMNGTANELLAEPIRQNDLISLLRDWRFPVCSKASFAQAQVTAGGIAGQCVRQDLSSKCQQNLYFCGELLDVDGDCGGYNLDWAWASGACAGRSAAAPAKQK